VGERKQPSAIRVCSTDEADSAKGVIEACIHSMHNTHLPQNGAE